MPPRKRSGDEFMAADQATRGCPLPADLLLEIFARSDAATLVRCSASCRSLRREIRRPAFIHRVCNDGAVPPRLLGFLRLDLDRVPMPPPSFSLAYPATPAAASLSETHLATFVSRSARTDAGHLAGYRTLTSRDSLVLLNRWRWFGKRHEVTLCVCDVMTGKGTFFPGPPDACTGHDSDLYYFYDKFFLLTAADSVGCPFLVFSANFSLLGTSSGSVMVWTFSPSHADGGAWSPVTFASHSRPTLYANKQPCDNVAVLRGGFIHWLIRGGQQDYYIFTYNVLTAASGWIELPAEVPAECRGIGKLHLTSSRGGGRLSLLVADRFKISVWLRLSGDDGAASCWALQAVIDTVHIASSVVYEGHCPYWPIGVYIVGSGARTDAVILLSHSMYLTKFEDAEKGLTVLELETKEMHVVSKKKHAFVYEIDMASRLSAMKNF